jgi:AraC-like DNA-binding protein
MPISNIDSVYHDPITGVGVRLGGGEPFSFQLHEAGCLKVSMDWNYLQVRSPFWRLYWANHPGAWIDCSGRRFDLESTRLLLVPSHTLFDTRGSLKPVSHFWIHFSLYPDLTARDGLPIRVPCNKALARRMAALTRKTAQADASTTRELHHLCSSLLHQVFADAAVAAHPPRLPPKLQALLDEIESAPARTVSVTELARRSGLSRGGFIRWFKQHMDVSPARYVLRRRIDHACRLLKFSPITIEEISERLGFANRNHFSRVFQRQMGSGPAHFRKS